MRGFITGECWSAEDIETLRESYCSGGIRAAMAALPDRTRSAIQNHASRLGLHSRGRWTEDEDNQLRWMWGTNSLARIASKLGRTQRGCYDRAERLGLLHGCTQGSEYVWLAAKRSGVNVEYLRKILDAAGVTRSLAMSRPYRGRGGRSRAKWRHHTVDRHDVDAAIAAWTRGEIDA